MHILPFNEKLNILVVIRNVASLIPNYQPILLYWMLGHLTKVESLITGWTLNQGKIINNILYDGTFNQGKVTNNVLDGGTLNQGLVINNILDGWWDIKPRSSN